MAVLYKHFAREFGDLDFSDEAQVELFNAESYGTKVSKQNGFSVGKTYLNVQVTMWREDIDNGTLFKCELYNDPNYPHWWLDSILKDCYPKHWLKGAPFL